MTGIYEGVSGCSSDLSFVVESLISPLTLSFISVVLVLQAACLTLSHLAFSTTLDTIIVNNLSCAVYRIM